METDPKSTPKLPLLSMQAPQSPDHSGMVTPPLYTLASVPFRWEEEPGKPRPCTALIPYPTTTTEPNRPKSLDLPPRLLLEPSPTTVLDGPYNSSSSGGLPKFTSSSFRFFRERQGSFDSSDGTFTSPEKGQFSKVVLVGKKLHNKGRGFLGSRRQRSSPKIESGGNSSFVYPSWSEESCVERIKMAKTRRNGSFSSLTQARSHFWAAVYKGFKQVIPWKTEKAKKEVPI